MLRCFAGPRLAALASAARAIPVAALLLAVVAGTGCIGGSTPYPPAVTGDVDSGGTRGTDGGARDAASLGDLGAPADLGLDPGVFTDGSTAAADADLPDAGTVDADVADADTDGMDADVADADTMDAGATDADADVADADADVADADALDADR